MNRELILDFIVIILLIVIAWNDFKTMEIPDGCNFLLGVCGVLSLGFFAEPCILERLLGVVAVSVPMYLVCLGIPGAFGGGDIKLVFVMGFYLGWKSLLAGVFIGIMIGGIQAACLLIDRKVKTGEGTHMAFGPALCTGLIVATLYGDELISWYFGLFY